MVAVAERWGELSEKRDNFPLHFMIFIVFQTYACFLFIINYEVWGLSCERGPF